jgi:hypothetical protein
LLKHRRHPQSRLQRLLPQSHLPLPLRPQSMKAIIGAVTTGTLTIGTDGIADATANFQALALLGANRPFGSIMKEPPARPAA